MELLELIILFSTMLFLLFYILGKKNEKLSSEKKHNSDVNRALRMRSRADVERLRKKYHRKHTL